MSETVRETFWRSWKKWHEGNPFADCPLCQRYASKRGSCRACPIAKEAHTGECRGTPFVWWLDTDADSDNEAEAVRAMANWLARLYKKNYGIHPSKEPWNKVKK